MNSATDAIVQNGRVVIEGLPYPDGQRVHVEIRDDATRSASEVRQALRGGVERFESPTEPMIPPDAWEPLP